MSVRKRLIGATIAVVATAVVLSGCSNLTFDASNSTSTVAPTPSAASTGISSDAAVVLLNAVPGLSDATVRSSISGLSTSTIIEVYVDDETAITAPGILDYVLRVGWATSFPPQAGLAKHFDAEPASLLMTVWKDDHRVELQAEANVLAGLEYPTFQTYSVYLSGPEYMGTWPGAVPTLSVG
ncbi:hypothetical protein E3T39_15795 [Cryobacterium suzukii]|uniref:Uncharacterized protein n=1 Tax=Cryobacterium suzukii TaxID=1259198 RepID=A0A4R9ABZ2_9MICO|nr:hypothetical protein [Cryobacterium suzukii]TFD56791.1 hypothetical protein E3T39_15795 [Cryobacterium suzukii]